MKMKFGNLIDVHTGETLVLEIPDEEMTLERLMELMRIGDRAKKCAQRWKEMRGDDERGMDTRAT